jgi:hypothetical protein
VFGGVGWSREVEIGGFVRVVLSKLNDEYETRWDKVRLAVENDPLCIGRMIFTRRVGTAIVFWAYIEKDGYSEGGV